MNPFARFLSHSALLAPLFGLASLAAPELAQAQYIAPGSAPAYGGGALGGGGGVTLSGMAGGPVDLSRVDGSCRGYAQATPSHVISTSGGPVRITTNASGDATFLVRLPDGRTLCDDDGGDGFNPLIETSTSAGRIEIWVGSYSGSAVTYTLMANGGTVVAPPPVSGSSLFGNLTVGAGMRDPAIGSGRFGGPMPASSISSGCAGHVSSAPSHLVNVTSYMSNLRFVVNGDADTTLLVQYPDGHFSCNDDGGGYPHPLVEGPTGPGTIRVWIGSYSSGTGGNYLLGVTTNPSISATNLSSYAGGGGAVVIAPPPSGGGVVVTPPPVSGAVRVDLDPRIPVTLYGIGVTPTVAVWSPRGGPSIEVTTTPRGSMITVTVSVNGTLQSVFDVPADMASGSIVTVTERADRRLLVRAERAPGAADPGATMLWLLNYAGGAVSIAESWSGTASERGPRWSR